MKSLLVLKYALPLFILLSGIGKAQDIASEAPCQLPSPPVDLTFGLRTLTMAKSLKRAKIPHFTPSDLTLKVNGENFGLINSTTKDFHGEKYLSIGRTLGREVIKFVPEKSPLLEKKYQDFEREVIQKLLPENLDRKILFTPMSFFKLLAQFMNTDVFPEKGNLAKRIKIWSKEWAAHPSRKKRDFFKGEKTFPLIPIDDFLKAGLGICRHHSLVAAYFIDRFSKEFPHILPFEGRVSIVRRKLPDGGGHSWLVYSTNPGKKGKVFHIDTIWRNVFNLNHESSREKLGRMKYGQALINEEFHLFH